jgi:hypothetical protein
MDRGKSSLEKDILLMLNDIKYFRDLSGTDTFEYTIGEISPIAIDYDIQEKLLEKMHTDGIVKIVERKQEISPTLSWVDEPLASKFKHTVYVLDVSETTFPKHTSMQQQDKKQKVAVSFNADTGKLALTIDHKIKQVGRLNYGQDPYLIMETLFKNTPGVLVNRNAIFQKEAGKKDLSRIISRSKLRHLEEYGLIKASKLSISRPLEPVALERSQVQKLISKIGKN